MALPSAFAVVCLNEVRNLQPAVADRFGSVWLGGKRLARLAFKSCDFLAAIYICAMAQLRLPALRELDFGQLDAKDEASRFSELLLAGYYDHREAALQVGLGNAWLLVGPKGSGKSAVFEHLALKWAGSPMQFLSIWDLGGWPVGDVSRLKTGITEGDAAVQSAWEFFLLLRLFESVAGDQGADMSSQVIDFRRALERANLLGNADLKTKFVDWTSSTAKFNVAGFGADATVRRHDVTLFQLAGQLRDAFSRITTDSRHVLAIDGLDQFFAETDVDWRSLAGLMHALQSVNLFLQSLDQKIRVVAAVRSEIFSVIPSTDSAKLLDRAIQLEWSDAGFDRTSRMWDLVNIKGIASIRDGFGTSRFSDIRDDYLATPIGIGRSNNIPEYFLSYTRMLPRDIVALLRQLQSTHPGATQVTENEAREAVRRYAEYYFVAEVINNLHGVIGTGGAAKVAAFKEALATLPSRIFNADALMRELAGVFEKEELRPLLRRMYDIGAIGIRRGSAGNIHTTFVFRRTEGGAFSFLADYVLHSALVVAWNIPW